MHNLLDISLKRLSGEREADGGEKKRVKGKGGSRHMIQRRIKKKGDPRNKGGCRAFLLEMQGKKGKKGGKEEEEEPSLTSTSERCREGEKGGIDENSPRNALPTEDRGVEATAVQGSEQKGRRGGEEKRG